MKYRDCCLRCKERKIGCHTNCLKYNQFVKQLQYIKQQKEEAKKQYSIFKKGVGR